MRRRSAPKLAAYVGLAALGLLAALVLGRPELVALAAPFALLAGLGPAFATDPSVSVAARLERERVLEDEDVELVVTLSSGTGADRLELSVELPDGLTVAGESDNPVALRLSRGEEREVRLQLHADRWGAYHVGLVVVRATDRFRLVSYEAAWDARAALRVYPLPETLLSLLRPLETQVFVGNQVSREKSEGIEFADLRQFVPGDRIRRVNWRASARLGELWVNELHAERNADVVLLLDSFAQARRGGASTLDMTVRAAYALAERYLRHKDRVGLVSFGGVLNWLVPGTGTAQLYRIVDSLLEGEVVLNYAWQDVDVIPRRMLPPQALVICLTPFLDERGGRALLDLRARGLDLAVVETSPLAFVQPGKGEAAAVAHRIWRLRRDAIRSRLVRAGVPIGVWDGEHPLAVALEGVSSFRRYRLQAHA